MRQLLSQVPEGTQSYKILKYILDKGSITTIEAFVHYGITRLSARIYDLRHTYGIQIDTENVIIKKQKGGYVKYARYSLGGNYEE